MLKNEPTRPNIAFKKCEGFAFKISNLICQDYHSFKVCSQKFIVTLSILLKLQNAPGGD